MTTDTLALEALIAGLTAAPPLQDPPKPTPVQATPAADPPWEASGVVESATVAVTGQTAIPLDTLDDTLALLEVLPQSEQSSEVSVVVTMPAPKASEEIRGTVTTPQPEEFVGDFGGESNGLKTFIDTDKLRVDIRIDPAFLDDAVRTHASMLVHYSMQAARARHQEEVTKNKLKVIEAQLYKAHRDQMAAAGKVTEAQIEAAVQMDPRWIEAKNLASEATLIADLCGSAREGFMQRRDMLVQTSVDRRTEHQGELRIKAAQEAAQGARTTALQHIMGAK